jgi:hypothetical protein
MIVAQPSSSTSSPQPSDPCYDGPPRRQPFVLSDLRTLELSCGSFPRSDRLFSTACALFDKNTGGGIPLPALNGAQVADRPRSSSCAKAQKCPSVSPLPATLTHSLSRNSFPCHSYANTRDMGAMPSHFFANLPTSGHSRETVPNLSALCFHGLTNPFSHNPFPFTSIQNPPGVGALVASHIQFPGEHSQSGGHRIYGVQVPKSLVNFSTRKEDLPLESLTFLPFTLTRSPALRAADSPDSL